MSSESNLKRMTTFKKSDVYGDWTLNGLTYKLFSDDFVHLLTDECKRVIQFDDISWRGFDLDKNKTGQNCICCAGVRFRSCDTKIPPIILKGVSNPGNKLYRTIDGKHRMMKMIADGDKSAKFYVLEYDDIKDKLRPF